MRIIISNAIVIIYLQHGRYILREIVQINKLYYHFAQHRPLSYYFSRTSQTQLKRKLPSQRLMDLRGQTLSQY